MVIVRVGINGAKDRRVLATTRTQPHRGTLA